MSALLSEPPQQQLLDDEKEYGQQAEVENHEVEKFEVVEHEGGYQREAEGCVERPQQRVEADAGDALVLDALARTNM